MTAELADRQAKAEKSAAALAAIAEEIKNKEAELASNSDSQKLIGTLRAAEAARLESRRRGLMPTARS